MEFSSPFYDLNFLKENEKEWSEGIRWAPTEDEKWALGIYVWYDENPALLNLPVNLYFYFDNELKHEETNEKKFIAVFESYNNDGGLIDRYVIGQPHNDIQLKNEYPNRNKILKCPIIIKTSDGDLEMLPNGKFRLLVN